MTTSIARRICRSILFSKPTPAHLSMSFCTSSNDYPPKFVDDDLNPIPFSAQNSQDQQRTAPPKFDDDDLNPTPFSAQNSQDQQRTASGGSLQNGVDYGIYKAILVGQVGQRPLKKILKSGRKFVLFSVGTGGIRSNRTPLMNEDPKEYANRCSVQWHRVCIYHENMLDMVMKHVLPGSIVYLEGNLETRVYTDQITGLARRLREIAIRRDGRIVFLGEGQDNQQTTPLKGVGYF